MAIARRPPPSAPLLIAHRAGNSQAELERIAELPIDLVEIDVHLFRGRLEARHAKSAGPFPFFWDGWRVHNPFARRPRLDEILAALRPDQEPMLDLKPILDWRGADADMIGLVATALDRQLAGRAVTICAGRWEYLAGFADRPETRVVYTVGKPERLPALHALPGFIDGVSIKRTLLTPAVVAELRRRTDLVMTWTVNDPESMHELAAMGVNGYISDAPERLAPEFPPHVARV